MASNGNDGSAIASQATQSSKAKRGKVCLNKLARRRGKGIREKVEFNQYGQPYKKFGIEMQSYIGMLTRQHVRICYDSWHHVPIEVKEFIWASVNTSYQDPETWKAGCLSSACSKWRTWKQRLYRDFIQDNTNDLNKLYIPPVGSGIKQVDWNQFVDRRLTAEFKELSDKQKERRSKNEYDHRVSRKGYAGLAEEMKDELTGVEEIDQGLKWIKARKPSEGGSVTKEMETAFKKIDDCINDMKDGTFKSKRGNNDLLTAALGKVEHSGRVHGVGANVTPSIFFKTYREKRPKIDEKTTHELEDAKKKIEEQSSLLEKYGTRLQIQDKVIYELVDRMGKIEAAVVENAKNMLNEDKGSCSVKVSHHKRDADDQEVIYTAKLDKLTALQGKRVEMMLEPNGKIVGYGTVVVGGDKIHCRPMPHDCLRVSVDEVVVEDALLPFRISDDMDTVGSALGTHVAWPTELVMARDTKDKTSGKEKHEKVGVKSVTKYALLPEPLRELYSVMERRLKQTGQELRIPLDIDVFGFDMVIWILLEVDYIPFCNLQPITGNCIVIYIWHLYRKMKENETGERFLFVNPFSISYTRNSSPLDRAHKLAERLILATSSQLVMVSCNVGEHWILTILDPHKEVVYLMDPLIHEHRATWKYIVDTAMIIFNASQNRQFNKPPTWVIVEGPMQPDYKQCGYYVMRYMKLIVKEVRNNAKGSISSWFKKGVYSRREIDEVREDWATCVMSEVLKNHKK